MTSRPCKCKRHCLACCDNTMMFAMPRSRTAHSSFKNRCPPASSLKPQWHPHLASDGCDLYGPGGLPRCGCSCGFCNVQRSAQLSNTRGPGTSSEAARGAAQSVSGASRGDRSLCLPDLTPAKSERRSSCPSICTSPSSKVCCTKATL